MAAIQHSSAGRTDRASTACASHFFHINLTWLSSALVPGWADVLLLRCACAAPCRPAASCRQERHHSVVKCLMRHICTCRHKNHWAEYAPPLLPAIPCKAHIHPHLQAWLLASARASACMPSTCAPADRKQQECSAWGYARWQCFNPCLTAAASSGTAPAPTKRANMKPTPKATMGWHTLHRT